MLYPKNLEEEIISDYQKNKEGESLLLKTKIL